MKKTILIFTMSEWQSKFEINRILDEAEKLGVNARRVLYKDLTFVDDKVFIKGEEINETNTSGAIFRVAGTVSGKYVEARNLFITLLQDKIKCLNAEGYLRWARMGKIPQLGVFLKNNIPIIPTKIFYTKEQVLAENFVYPVISKNSLGYQGKSVRKFDDRKSLAKFIKKMDETQLGMYLWQKCLPTNWDLRIIVLGTKVIGAMKRTAVGDEFRSNFSLGGEVEKWDLSESDKIIAENVAKSCGLDYGGVDIMKDNEGNSFVLEVNRQCQFQGFEKATGINVARKMIEFFGV
jgi:RimK family alpha-L-glutamate ligase